jgi:gamma-glutamyl hydrolase
VTTIDTIVKNTNGILFMGGEPSLPPTASYMYGTILAQYDLQDPMTMIPMWGTCLGFEWIAQCHAGLSVLSSGFDAENITLPLTFTADAISSRMYTSSPTDLLTLLANNNVTMNNHEGGVTPVEFEATMADEFTLLSTNVDRQGMEFVSSYEHRTYPIYGTQYHPEKSMFE